MQIGTMCDAVKAMLKDAGAGHLDFTVGWESEKDGVRIACRRSKTDVILHKYLFEDAGMSELKLRVRLFYTESKKRPNKLFWP